MKMSNKGFTLIELLAVMVLLGIVMAVTIPNIAGISAQNKITTYAEDAKKFKNSAEYKFRGDSTIVKPEVNGDCAIMALSYLHGNEYDNPPYGGEYLMNKSFVVIVKNDNQYKYYVQLVEKFSSDDTDNYRGFKLMDSSDLEGDSYLDKLDEGNNFNNFIDIDLSDVGNILSKISSDTTCTNLLEVYYSSI